MNQQTKHFYEFGFFRLDPAKRVLSMDGKPLPLTAKVFDTLLVLVERRGQVVEKDELMKLLWPDSFVEEATLNKPCTGFSRPSTMDSPVIPCSNRIPTWTQSARTHVSSL